MKPNFFTTVFQICTRVSSFNNLKKLSFRRIVFYQFMLAFILSVITGFSFRNMINTRIDEVSKTFIATFAGVKIEDNRLVFFKNGDKIAESNGGYFKFNYYPSIKELDDSWGQSDDLKNGLIFLPECVVAWSYTDRQKYMLQPVIFRKTLKKDKKLYFFKSCDEVNEFVKQLAQRKGALFSPFSPLTTTPFVNGTVVNLSEQIAVLKKFFLISGIFGVMLAMLSFCSFLALVFSFFTAMWSKNTPLEWKFVEALKINIMVGFPAMIITTLYSVAGAILGGVSFVMLFCFIIYNFVVFRYLTKERLKID